MARYARARAWPRILLYIFLILALIVSGIIWFDVLGFIDARRAFSPVLSIFGVGSVVDRTDEQNMLLLDSYRLQRLDESVELRIQEIRQQLTNLDGRQIEIDQNVALLEEREAAQVEREKSFNETLKQHDDRERNLTRISSDLVSMPPADAVRIIVGFDDQLLIDVLRKTQEIADAGGEFSLVPYWLSQMPAERASDIQRKMAQRSGF